MKNRFQKAIALVLSCILMALLFTGISLAENRPYTIYRPLDKGCRGEDVFNVEQKLYELGYLAKLPAEAPEDAVYTPALSSAVLKYEKVYYIDPATVVPPTEPIANLRASSMYVQAADGILTQEEQTALLRVEPNITSPVNVNAVAKNGAVQLSWESVKFITGYRVYRNGIAIADVTANKYTDTNATQGKDYTYRVNALTFSTEPEGADVEVYLDYYYQKIAMADLRHSPASYAGQYVQVLNLRVQEQRNVEGSDDAYLIALFNKTPVYLYLPGFKSWGWENMKNGFTITQFLLNDKINVDTQFLGATTVQYNGEDVIMPYFKVQFLTLF